MLNEPNMDKVAELLDALDAFGTKENIKFTITATIDPEAFGDNIKKYC